MPTARRVVIAVVVFTVLASIVLAITSHLADIGEIDWQWSPAWLVLSVGLLATGVTIHCETWRRMLRAMGGDMRWQDAWEAWTFSMLARYVPTQVLMPVTRATMAAKAGVPRSLTVTSFAYELLLALGAASALSLAYFMALPELSNSLLRFVPVLIPVLLVGCAHPRVVDFVSVRIGARMGFEPSHVALSPWQIAQAVTAYTTSFAILGLSIYALGRGVQPIGSLTYDVIASFAIGYLAGFLGFFLPAGLGAREGAMIGALASVMPVKVAFAVTAASRIINTIDEVVFAAGSGLLARRARRRRASPPAPAGPSSGPAQPDEIADTETRRHPAEQELPLERSGRPTDR